MPLYPGLMSLFYKEGMSDQEFFERGKKIGIAIGLFGSTVAFLVLSRVSKPVDALTGTAITMFTVFAYKSPYFQAEVLFYTINFLLFYLLLSLVGSRASGWPLLLDLWAALAISRKRPFFRRFYLRRCSC